MKQTAQFGLNQWECTDRVLMEDFNNDNQKIDAALAKTCQPYIISYTGDGNPTKTLEFPGKPLFVIIIGGDCLLVAIRGRDTCHCVYNILQQTNISASWGEKFFTWNMKTVDPIFGANNLNVNYQVMALLAMES